MTAERGTVKSNSAFFGELYLRSTRPFLLQHLTEQEGRYLREHLTGEGPFLDVGCGHGRHLDQLAGLPVVGVDLDPLSLHEAREAAPVVRADFFRLPFRDGAFRTAFSWYNTLFTFGDELVPKLLREVVRCIGSKGTLVIQASNYERVRREPEAHYDGELPDGSRLVEDCHYNEAARRDEVERRLTGPDGRVMAASFFIRYYPLDELTGLLQEAGCDVRWVHGGVDESQLDQSSTDVIVGAQKRE